MLISNAPFDFNQCCSLLRPCPIVLGHQDSTLGPADCESNPALTPRRIPTREAGAIWMGHSLA